MAPHLSIFAQSGWSWNFDETANQRSSALTYRGLLQPYSAPPSGGWEPWLLLSPSPAPEMEWEVVSTSLVPTYTVNFCPWYLAALCPMPQIVAWSWTTCFLCWLIFSDWRLLGGDGENEEGFVWLPRGDLRHLCSLSRQNHRLRCHHPDGHTLWHSWALWWHQGIH